MTRQTTASAAGTVSFLRVPANADLPRNPYSVETDSKNKRGVAAGQAAADLYDLYSRSADYLYRIASFTKLINSEKPAA